ncbi:hypothetical protein CC85DRAFT_293289 [Cutaneotrichosporon oleaginosum]|uniref:Uncharacterized protein n=1 Tax=Cutaneotrichosporon oleaginosum TaxID=879819 RepID=A0A0J1AYF7_9TREE|nr:uncharacterized protein CC85DRAFT_293289 [Cutaneotrichosporon oleaginosum]KLT40364.1 hypothetical protein CC85DRAFT_293289 [Cutaneotrichosporon oleaginosum]
MDDDWVTVTPRTPFADAELVALDDVRDLVAENYALLAENGRLRRALEEQARAAEDGVWVAVAHKSKEKRAEGQKAGDKKKSVAPDNPKAKNLTVDNPKSKGKTASADAVAPATPTLGRPVTKAAPLPGPPGVSSCQKAGVGCHKCPSLAIDPHTHGVGRCLDALRAHGASSYAAAVRRDSKTATEPHDVKTLVEWWAAQ